MTTDTKLPTKTSNRIWVFELFSDEVNNKWHVFADGKKSWECDMDEFEEAPQVMSEYFDRWDNDEVTI